MVVRLNQPDLSEGGRLGPTAEAGSIQRWDAFISYRRKDARILAHWLRDCLQRYQLPPDVLQSLSAEKRELHQRRPRIYIDQAFEKPSEDFLLRKLLPALDNSNRLVVVSTPSCFEPIVDDNGTEQPNWLVVEIDRFLKGNAEHKRVRPIDIVLGPGAPDTRFPGRLAERAHWDPTDLRQFTWWRRWRLGSRFDAGITKLVAGLYDVHESQLPALHREEAVRRNRLWTWIAGAVASVAVVVTALAGVAWYQRGRAIAEQNRALTSESLLLAGTARQQTAAGYPVTGMQLALRGLPDGATPDRPIVGETLGALAEAMGQQREISALRGHEGPVLSVAFAADGRLASGGQDGTVRVWPATGSGEPLVLRGHRGWVGSVKFAADGRLASGSQDGTVRVVWLGSSVEELVAEARRRLPRELTEEEERRFYLRQR